MSSQEPQIGPSFFSKVRKQFLLILALLGLIIAIPGYIQTAHNYAEHYNFVAHNGQPLKIVAARGDTVTISLPVKAGISGYWASDQGLDLSLDGISTPLPVVEPKKQGWGDDLHASVSEIGEDFTIAGSATIPSSIGGAEQRVLSGTFSGRIYYPKVAGVFQFQETTLDIQVPVQIQLMPQGSQRQSSGQLSFEIFAGIAILCGALLLLRALWALLRTFAGLLKPETPETRSRVQIRNDWFWGLGAGAGFAAICGGVLAFLLIGISTTGSSNPHPPGDISSLGWLACGLVALSVWLGTIAVMIKDDKKQGAKVSTNI